MRFILLALSFITASFQNARVSKMTDSQRDGFAAPDAVGLTLPSRTRLRCLCCQEDFPPQCCFRATV
jgi:hypothetical protein